MFIPIEGALAVALQEDPGLTAEAVAANVAIATPTTLMTASELLPMCGRSNAKQERRDHRTPGGKIYDKLVGFIEEMNALGVRLNQAQTSYADAMAKLSSGRGNLTTQVAHLKKLGAKASKSLPANLMDESDDLLDESDSDSVLSDDSDPTEVKTNAGAGL